MPEIIKSCRTCHYFRFGKCTLADQLFNFETKDAVDIKISNGELQGALKETLKGHLKNNEIYGTSRNLNAIEHEEIVIDKIVRVIRKIARDDANYEIEANIKDYDTFYCARYE